MTRGWKAKAGMVLEDTWGTPKKVVNTYPLLTMPRSATPESIQINSVDSRGGYSDVKEKSRYYSDDFTSYLFWPDGSDLPGILFQAALGALNLSGSTRYYTITASQPPSMTVCVDNGEGELAEYSGAKILEMQISGTVHRPVKLSMRILSRSPDTSSTVNPDSSSWSLIDSPPIMFETLTIMANDQVAAALSSADEFDITGFEIHIRGDWYIGPNVETAPEIREQKRYRWQVVGNLTFPVGSAAADTFETKYRNQIKQKLCLSFAASLGGYSYVNKLWLPACSITNANTRNIEGERGTNPVVSFQAVVPVTVPSGFPSYLSNLIVERSRS